VFEGQEAIVQILDLDPLAVRIDETRQFRALARQVMTTDALKEMRYVLAICLPVRHENSYRLANENPATRRGLYAP
jgi:hypothetical protein